MHQFCWIFEQATTVCFHYNSNLW